MWMEWEMHRTYAINNICFHVNAASTLSAVLKASAETYDTDDQEKTQFFCIASWYASVSGCYSSSCYSPFLLTVHHRGCCPRLSQRMVYRSWPQNAFDLHVLMRFLYLIVLLPWHSCQNFYVSCLSMCQQKHPPISLSPPSFISKC